MVDYEMEDFADQAVDELREFIDTEKQLILHEHSFIDKLNAWDVVIMHFDERVPKEARALHDLTQVISLRLNAIRDLVNSDRLKHVRFVKEERKHQQRLAKDIKHRNWQAVKKDIAGERQEEQKELRLEVAELRNLRKLLLDLKTIMRRSKLILTHQASETQDKANYEQLEHYYLLQIYKFVWAYERIFYQLWQKEKGLLGKLR